MLVLTRKPDEAVYIGKNVKLVVLSIEGGKVRLGFEAPADVPIHRKEVYQRIYGEEDVVPDETVVK